MNRFFQKVLRKSGLFSYLNLTLNVRINNKRFKIPVIHKIGIGNLGTTEIWMIDLLDQLFTQRKGCFLDVGANIGQTLLKVKSVFPLIEYYGFEPNPACVFYLRELIKINSFENCHILPMGVFNNIKIMDLLYFGQNEDNSGSSVIQDYRPNNKIFDRQPVPLFDLDYILDSYKIMDLAIIKIDVEGAESEVLEGMQETIKSHNPYVLMEILPIYNINNVVRIKRQEKIESIMNNLGYSLFQIKKTRNNQLNGLEYINSIGIHKDLNQCDYLFVPGN